MKAVLAALNARYIHTNPAVRSVAAYGISRGVRDLGYWERTIHHRYRLLLRELWEMQADVLVFSCYIWNIGLVCRLARDLRRLSASTVLAVAGPEVSYHTEAFLRENPAFDAVLPGEGEEQTARFLLELQGEQQGEQQGEHWGRQGRRENLRQVAAARRHTPEAALPGMPPLALDALPFAYGDLDQLGGRILYYESSRGCPYRCSYCLSSVETGVRSRSLPLVFRDLARFLQAGARQVKFVDRTFNWDGERARRIWRFLMEKDNGLTNFHFELAGELLDDASLDLLRQARPGLFQMEIGVQSLNPDTLRAIRRPADPARLFQRIRRLQEGRNIHLHLDLIAGLPEEDLASFRQSFDGVYGLGPEQFQPGFLKVLKGSAMERDAEKYGIVYQEEAPYEVLSTRWLSFGELTLLHGVADMVEIYHNSGRFRTLLPRLIGRFPSPFAFFAALWEFYRKRGYEEAAPAKIGYYELLGDFLRERGAAPDEALCWCCRYDLALCEKPRKIPTWVDVDGSRGLREQAIAYFASLENGLSEAEDAHSPKQLERLLHVEVFPFHPETGEVGSVTLLFDYRAPDHIGKARVSSINLPRIPPENPQPRP